MACPSLFFVDIKKAMTGPFSNAICGLKPKARQEKKACPIGIKSSDFLSGWVVPQITCSQIEKYISRSERPLVPPFTRRDTA